jgi:membrane protein required for colicin V production
MRLADWNGFDWFLVLVVVVSMGFGFRRGIVRTVFGFAGFILGFVLAAWNYTWLGDWMNSIHLITSVSTARIAAFLSIVVAISVGVELLARLLQKTVRAVGLGLVDRGLGAGFGFLRGCLVGIALIMIPSTLMPQSKLITGSVLSPYLFAVAHDVSFLVPQYVQQRMINGAFNLKENSSQWINRH